MLPGCFSWYVRIIDFVKKGCLLRNIDIKVQEWQRSNCSCILNSKNTANDEDHMSLYQTRMTVKLVW